MLSDFFPPGTPAQEEMSLGGKLAVNELESPPLTLDKVRDAIFHARSFNAPGLDGVPAVVRKELWPVTHG